MYSCMSILVPEMICWQHNAGEPNQTIKWSEMQPQGMVTHLTTVTHHYSCSSCNCLHVVEWQPAVWTPWLVTEHWPHVASRISEIHGPPDSAPTSKQYHISTTTLWGILNRPPIFESELFYYVFILKISFEYTARLTHVVILWADRYQALQRGRLPNVADDRLTLQFNIWETGYPK